MVLRAAVPGCQARPVAIGCNPSPPAIPVPRSAGGIPGVATQLSVFRTLIEQATSRRSLAPLLHALGLEPCEAVVPPEAWPGFGVRADPEVDGVTVVGRSDSLAALLVGLRGTAAAERMAALARGIRARNPNRLNLLVFADPAYAHLTLAAFGLDGRLRHLTIERADVRVSDLEALRDMVPTSGERGLELALRHARALDRSGVTRRFFRDFRARRTAVADSWTGVPGEAEHDRNQLALLLLSRLTFLCFLERRGALAGDDRYLARLFGAWCASAPRRPRTFYRDRLVPLFFGALNRRPADREPGALALGTLPYLNGGLFEPHALERRYGSLDLPDREIGSVFHALLDRYRFTVREAAEGAGHGVDPEVLGRVFEGLMAPAARADTGSFYTPQRVVRRVVREAITEYAAGYVGRERAVAVIDGRPEAVEGPAGERLCARLERLRILDPACGSGAFLLGALDRLAATIASLSDRSPSAVRRDIVARTLHGVDLLDDAALLCALRLWLALSESDPEVRPLPNLDRRIRQGDALIDPLDMPLEGGGIPGPDRPWLDGRLRAAIRAVEPAARRYLESGPEERHGTRAELEAAERRLADRWIGAVVRHHEGALRELRVRSLDRDLFGAPSTEARRAAAAIDATRSRLHEVTELRRALDERGSLPFFSFGVHFAHAAGGFDLVITNPPWVRSHRWPARLRGAAARRYEVCREPAWAMARILTGAPAAAGAQVDLSLLFVERSLRLLAPGGILAVLLPAKMLRALYGAAARRILLRDLEILAVEDYALDQRAMFRADAFAAVLIGRKRSASPAGASAEPAGERVTERAGSGSARIRLVRRGSPPLEFRLRSPVLPLFAEDPSSPWVLAPPDVLASFRAMQAVGPPIGLHPGLRVRRGIMTGRNDVLLVSRARFGLGGLARIEAEGHRRARRAGSSARAAGRFRGWVESSGIRPLVRGADMDAFGYRTTSYVIWCHDRSTQPVEPPPRLARYLQRHRSALRSRAGWKPGRPLGMVFRLSAETLGPKVAWHDLSDTVRAAALPAEVQVDGVARELVPLNTVYFLPVPHENDAILLAGILNSLPVRTFARAIAERAKDARFRFFAWTIASVPLPSGWRDHPAAGEVARISRAAHEAGGIDRARQEALDRAVAALYGLEPAHLEAILRWDTWLKGTP